MTYDVVQADTHILASSPKPYVFLGGNSRGKDWRLEFFHRFEHSDVTFISSRRDVFADPHIDPAGHVEQVEWDKEMLSACDMAVYWLGDGLANQAARVEIGYLHGKKTPLIIGAEDGFLGMEHLTAFSGLVLCTSLDGLMNRFSSLLGSYRPEDGA